MSFLHSELAQWRANPLREMLAGAVATFALIPEVIAFSFVAGVDPQVGLFASFVIGIVIAIFGGRPAMISAAAIVYAVTIPGNTINPVGVMQLLLGTALAITAEFYRGKGSQQSGSFAALLMLSIFELIMAFNYTFRVPFDAQGGTWMLELSAHGILLVLLPGFILRHITRKQCSKN